MAALAVRPQLTSALVRLVLLYALPCEAMLSSIQSLSAASLPLLPYLLRGARAGEEETSTSVNCGFAARIAQLRIPPSLLSSTRQEIIDEFRLNHDQVAVLDHCVAWLQPSAPPHPPPSPIVLVHGAPGSGKTSLLVALIVFLHRVLSAVDPRNTIRVLVACLTNVAVDGILSALLQRSQECFVRIGSIKRIAANVIRHTLHDITAGKGVEETHEQAKEELRRQIQERRDSVRQQQQRQARESQADRSREGECDGESCDSDSSELRDMEAALAEMKAERGQDRKRRLLGKRVVAVTTAASCFDILSDCDFPLVLLDECSQMIEPDSLHPMQRFHCQRLIAVGDPKQLPPTLTDVEAAAASYLSAASGDKSITVESCLAKPLFERLHNAGLPTILLRHQYRMHPTLAHMPNQLFYDGQLRDGVDEEARPPLLQRVDDLSKSLGPLTFVNVPRGQQLRVAAHSDGEQPAANGRAGEWDSGSSSSSWRNDSEVRVVVLTITALLQRGIPASSIGVITFYRPQWLRLKSEIASLMTFRDAQLRAQQSHHNSPHAVEAGGVSEEGSNMWRNPNGAVAGESTSGPTKRSKRVRAEGVQVNTVDSFQGAEKNIIILSTVRTSASGFLDDPKRINVAVTRARHHLLIVGHHPTLLQLKVWKPIVSYVSSKCPGCFFPTDDAFLSALHAMQAVQLAVAVSQRDGAGQIQPSETSSAACRRAGRRGRGAGQPKAAVKSAGQTEEDDGEEQLEESTVAPSAVAAVVPHGETTALRGLSALSAPLAAEWMDDEDAPLSLLSGFAASAPVSLDGPLTATVTTAQQRGATHAAFNGLSMSHDSDNDNECADECGCAESVEEAIDRSGRDGAEDATSGASQCNKRVRLSDTRTAQLPHSQRKAETEAAAQLQRDDSSSDELDEPVRLRGRKRVHLVSDDEEADCTAEETSREQPQRSQSARQLCSTRRDRCTGEPVDAFDFDQYAQQSREAEERPAENELMDEPHADIDIFALLRSEDAHDREAEKRKQRQARVEVEQSLTRVLLNEQRRQQEEV